MILSFGYFFLQGLEGLPHHPSVKETKQVHCTTWALEKYLVVNGFLFFLFLFPF